MTNPTQSTGGVEVVAWRSRYRSEPGMIGHYPWSYSDASRRAIARGGLPHYEYEALVTQDDHLAALASARESEERLAEALRAYQDAEAMSVYGDHSGFVWGNQTMRSEGNHAYGYICDKHGLGYTSTCVCCRDEYEKHTDNEDLKARIARDEAFRRARLTAGHALAAHEAKSGRVG